MNFDWNQRLLDFYEKQRANPPRLILQIEGTQMVIKQFDYEDRLVYETHITDDQKKEFITKTMERMTKLAEQENWDETKIRTVTNVVLRNFLPFQ